MNRFRGLLLLFIGLFIHATFFAQNNYQLAPESSVTIHGASTLHDWKAAVPDYEGNIQITDDLLKKNLKEGAAVSKAVLKFNVETIDGGRGPSMNKKIKTALQSTEHPQIVFELSEPAKITTVSDKKTHQFIMQANGSLRIAGASQSVSLKIEGQRMENGNISLKTEQPLKMSDFKIEPPSAMFGQIVTKDDIRVVFDLVLSPKS